MQNKLLKTYLITVVLLLLAGAAVLVVGYNYLERYEREQERLEQERIANITPTPTHTPIPTLEPEEIVEAKYKYTIEVPEGFTVLGDNVSESEAKEGKKAVLIQTDSPEFEVKIIDEYGYEVDYRSGNTLETKTYNLILPDNFKVTLKEASKTAEDYIVSVEEAEEYRWCYEYADMPKIASYAFTNALNAPDLEIRDNLDALVTPFWTDGYFTIREQAVLHEIPSEGITEEEIMEYVKTWSSFMTDDLKPDGFDAYIFTDKKTGKRVPYVKGMDVQGLDYRSRSPRDYGFSVLEEYLLPDSYRYRVLKEYAYGSDIGLTSRHLPDPEFINEKIDNFVMYTDSFFSIDSSFTKILILPTLGYSKRYDTTSVRVYFIKNPDSTGNRKWLMADMITLSENSETK
jgi:hypothetical protein